MPGEPGKTLPRGPAPPPGARPRSPVREQVRRKVLERTREASSGAFAPVRVDGVPHVQPVSDGRPTTRRADARLAARRAEDRFLQPSARGRDLVNPGKAALPWSQSSRIAHEIWQSRPKSRSFPSSERSTIQKIPARRGGAAGPTGSRSPCAVRIRGGAAWRQVSRILRGASRRERPARRGTCARKEISRRGRAWRRALSWHAGRSSDGRAAGLPILRLIPDSCGIPPRREHWIA